MSLYRARRLFLEFHRRCDTRATTVIKHIQENIARYGIMDELISDSTRAQNSQIISQLTESSTLRHLHYTNNQKDSRKKPYKLSNRSFVNAESGDDVYLCLLD